MKILLISYDQVLINLITNSDKLLSDEVIFNNENLDSLSILTFLLSSSAQILIYDNDISPDSLQILTTFRKMNQSAAIIFVASEINSELGREISQLGLYFRVVKPVSESEITDSIKSIKKKSLNKKQ